MTHIKEDSINIPSQLNLILITVNPTFLETIGILFYIDIVVLSTINSEYSVKFIQHRCNKTFTRELPEIYKHELIYALESGYIIYVSA